MFDKQNQSLVGQETEGRECLGEGYHPTALVSIFGTLDHNRKRYRETQENRWGQLQTARRDGWLTLLGPRVDVSLRMLLHSCHCCCCCQGQPCAEANKKKGGRGNEGTLNLGGSCRLYAINYVTHSNMPYQNSGNLYAAASRTESITVSVFAIKHILYK